MISGNIHSYARSLNNPEQLDMLKQHVDLSSIIADITADKDETRQKLAADKKRRQADTAAKKAAAAEKDKNKALELLPGTKIDISKGLDHVLKLSVARKRDIVKYKYDHNVGLAKIKEELDGFLTERMSLLSSDATAESTTAAAVLHAAIPNVGAMLEETTLTVNKEEQSG